MTEQPTVDELEESRMPFLEHLRDLQVRIRNAAIWLVLGFAVAFCFKEQIYALLARPIVNVWTQLSGAELAAQWQGKVPPELIETVMALLGKLPIGEPSFQFKSLIEPFWVYFSVALWGGIFVSSPFTFYQLWKFIAPGLYKNERRWGVAFAISAAVLFIAGAALCYFLILPITYQFLLSYSSTNISQMVGPFGSVVDLGQQVALKPQLFMEEYLTLTRKLMLGFGIAFELPLVIFFLSLIGAVTHRGLIRFNRYMIVIAFLVAAILTPPEVYSQVLMAMPLIILYNLSIVVSWLITRRRERKEAELSGPERPTPP